MRAFVVTSVSTMALALVVSRVFQTASIDTKRRLFPVFVAAAAAVLLIPGPVVSHRRPGLWQVLAVLAVTFIFLRGSWVCRQCGSVVTPKVIKPRDRCQECQAPR
jgi:protein-S-isoprenylcysteine O-methyltransferase Ste14